MTKLYRVVVEGGLEGLSFPDLYMEKDGVKRHVRVMINNYIPTVHIDKEVLQKSLDVGSLGRALKAGWVVEEVSSEVMKPQKVNLGVQQLEPGSYAPVEMRKDDIEKLRELKKDADPKSEKNIAAAAAVEQDLKDEIGSDTYFCIKCKRNHKVESSYGRMHVQFREKKKDIETKTDKDAPEKFHLKTRKSGEEKVKENLTVDKVNSYEDFVSLKYFDRLKFLQQSEKYDIIKEVMEKSDKLQLRNNAQLRLAKDRKL